MTAVGPMGEVQCKKKCMKILTCGFSKIIRYFLFPLPTPKALHFSTNLIKI